MLGSFNTSGGIVFLCAAIGQCPSCVVLAGSILDGAKGYAMVSLICIALCWGGVGVCWAGDSNTGFFLSTAGSVAGSVMSFVLYHSAGAED